MTSVVEPQDRAHRPVLVDLAHRSQPGRVQRLVHDALEGDGSLHRASGTVVDAADIRNTHPSKLTLT
jgi:hypothetical protein